MNLKVFHFQMTSYLGGCLGGTGGADDDGSDGVSGGADDDDGAQGGGAVENSAPQKSLVRRSS